MKLIQVSENEAGQRLDKLLAKYLNLAPKSFLYKMLRKKNITLNGKKADGSEQLALNDEIKMFLADETIEKFSELVVEKVKHDLDIVYEDVNLLILNKPAGMLSQKAEKTDVSIVEHIISYLLDSEQITEEELQSFKPSICNRLDRNTSGIIVAGKTLVALQIMAELFRDRSIHKYYQCIVTGKVASKELIEGYLTKDETTNKVRVLTEQTPEGEYIKTEYEPVRTTEQYSLLNVKLITGKSHQIRAHLASIGHPIIGDFKYGSRNANLFFKKNYGLEHQLLHSYRLVFPELSGELSYLSGKEFLAKKPAIFEKIEKELL